MLYRLGLRESGKGAKRILRLLEGSLTEGVAATGKGAGGLQRGVVDSTLTGVWFARVDDEGLETSGGE